MASLEDQCRSEHAGIGQCTKAFVGPPGRPHVAEVISTILVMNANVTPIRWQESALCNQLPYLASSIVVSPCTVLVPSRSSVPSQLSSISKSSRKAAWPMPVTAFLARTQLINRRRSPTPQNSWMEQVRVRRSFRGSGMVWLDITQLSHFRTSEVLQKQNFLAIRSSLSAQCARSTLGLSELRWPKD